MKLWCCGCDAYVDAELVFGDKIYPHRPDLYKLAFYQCPCCRNYVGTHKQWGPGEFHGRKHNIRALGCIPTPELKNARHHIHKILDPLWQGKRSGTRKRLYKRLSDALGYEYHTANTKSIDECRKVYRLILDIAKESK